MSPLKFGSNYSVPKELIDGGDFEFLGGNLNIKIGAELQRVHVAIDKLEQIVYWDNVKTKHRRFVFVDAIVDVRVPKSNPTVFQIVCNKDFSNVEFFGFDVDDEEVALDWSEKLFYWVQWNKTRYHSVIRYMKTLFAPYLLQLQSNGFRFENAYEHLNVPYLKSIARIATGTEVSYSTDFIDIYLEKVKRPDLQEIYNQLCRNEGQLSVEKFCIFINETQRDQRLNEELHPFKSQQWTSKLIKQLESNDNATSLSFRGFAKYLLELESDIETNSMKLKTEEMSHPITHYYINSSHNTYLNGNQIQAAKALPGNPCQICITETEMYRQVLLAGCRCIELDCWDGPTGPVITHGPIALQKINVVPFKEVCEAIMDTGFKTTEYPIVLSIENHCSPDQQQQMANYFMEVFGDHLQAAPLEDYPCQKSINLPPPSALKKKILLKGSKASKKGANDFFNNIMGKVKGEMTKLMEIGTNKLPQNLQEYINLRESRPEQDMMTKRTVTEERYRAVQEQFEYVKNETVAETKQALADLINYFQTTPRLDLDDPEYLMHSGSEQKIDNMITNGSSALIEHTMRHIVRVYPDIGRVCSSNFIPMYFWTAGCQMLALNFQTPGLPMQMNQTLFEENGRSGYVLKASSLRSRGHKMSVHDKTILVGNRLEVKVRSAQLLNLISLKKRDIKTSVALDLYDLPHDTVRDKYETAKTKSQDDGTITFYPRNRFVFHKIIKPEHSMLHVRLLDENGEEIAQRFLPVHKIQPGFRHIILRNKANLNVGPATVFMEIDVKVYVPAYQAELRENYVAPLKNVKEKEEFEQKLVEPLRDNSSKKKKKMHEELVKLDSNPISVTSIES